MTQPEFLVLFEAFMSSLNAIKQEFGQSVADHVQIALEEPYIVLKRPPQGLEIVWTISIYDRDLQEFRETFRFPGPGIFKDGATFYGFNGLMNFVGRPAEIPDGVAMMRKGDDGQWKQETYPLIVDDLIREDRKVKPKVMRCHAGGSKVALYTAKGVNNDKVDICLLAQRQDGVFAFKHYLENSAIFGPCVKDEVFAIQTVNKDGKEIFETMVMTGDEHLQFSALKYQLPFDSEVHILAHIPKSRDRLVQALFMEDGLHLQIAMCISAFPHD
jgi:hypothetical protein